VNYPRPKTGIGRRCHLWPETVQALREALACRPEPKDPAIACLAFINQRGAPLVGIRETNRTDGVSVAFGMLLKKLGFHRPGLGFYLLRHCFRTIADEAKDQPAIDHVMGHADASMAAHYHERISDERLVAVAEHVRQWLFGDQADDDPEGEESSSNQTSDLADAPAAHEGDARPILKLFIA
jgi:integrase